ncbi:hypothetical protein HNR06_002673 [Nocardiopsis arvandica]|uniref:Integrase n=1 Tax=Nocardiopsis sinuspersici TaxID=501010 RepID=A0A7Y9XCI1_9ACTN|nr:hypothetical protein [Nocardiopsis sinuspersici]NYH53084.1 hypothetical protein [Nocardiopsis sinuspersici]
MARLTGHKRLDTTRRCALSAEADMEVAVAQLPASPTAAERQVSRRTER